MVYKSAFISFDGEKGGTGKSFACSAFIDWAITQRHLPLLVIDADTSNPDVGRRFQTVATKFEQISIREEGGWMRILNLADANKDALVGGALVLNLPANIAESFPEERALLYRSIQGISYRSSLIWTINTEADSVNLFGGMMTNLKDYLNSVVVMRNLIFGKPKAFSAWEKSKMRGRFLEPEIGGIEVDMPRLLPEVASIVALADAASYRTHDTSMLDLGQFVVLEDWQRRSDAVWNSLAGPFGLGEAAIPA